MDEHKIPEEAQAERSVLTTLQQGLLWTCFYPTAIWLTIAAFVVVSELDIASSSIRILAFAAVSLLAWPLSRRLWRVLNRGKFRAGFVVGALAWFYGPAYALIAGVMLLAGATCADLDIDEVLDEVRPQQLAHEEPEVSDDSQGLDTADDTLGVFGETDNARQFAPEQHPTHATDLFGMGLEARNTAFGECVDDLYEMHDADSQIDRAIRSMLAAQISVNTTQALIYDVVVDVCLKHAEQPKPALGRYFGKALKHRKIKRWKEQQKHDACSLESWHAYDPDASVVVEFRHAMCQLDPEYALALDLKAKGESNQEIADQLGVSKSTAGNKISEARDELARILGRQRQKLR